MDAPSNIVGDNMMINEQRQAQNMIEMNRAIKTNIKTDASNEIRDDMKH